MIAKATHSSNAAVSIYIATSIRIRLNFKRISTYRHQIFDSITFSLSEKPVFLKHCHSPKIRQN